MQIGRTILAHVFAVLSGSLLLMSGVEMILQGPLGALDGAAKWLGGLLIFSVVAIATAPVGMTLRWLVGKLPMRPMEGALLGGASIGIASVFVLHPALYPNLSLATHPVQLVILHLIAGLAGGWAWHRIEFSTKEKPGV